MTIPDADLSIEIPTSRPAREAFDAINHVQEWWPAVIDGSNDRVGDEFTYDIPGLHGCTMRVVQLVQDRRIVWRVVKSRLIGAADPGEWVGTDLTFEMIPAEAGAIVRFTHVGVEPTRASPDSGTSAGVHFVVACLERLLGPSEDAAGNSVTETTA
jgi:hypothetical protein